MYDTYIRYIGNIPGTMFSKFIPHWESLGTVIRNADHIGR